VESIENPCIENPQAPELNPWGRLQNLKSKIENRMTGGDAPYLRPDCMYHIYMEYAVSPV
jgi:hypothetical protein